MAHRPSASALCSAYAAAGLVLVFVWSSLSDHVFGLRSALPEFLIVNPRVFFLTGILALSTTIVAKPKFSRTADITLSVLLPFIGATGTACIALASNQNLFPPAMLCITGLVALGMGYCWLVVSYGLLLARTGSVARIVYCLAAALSVEPVVRLVIESTFEHAAISGIAVCLPFVSMALLRVTHAMLEREETTSCFEKSNLAEERDETASNGKTTLKSKTGKTFILLGATAALLATVRTLSPCGTWDAKFDPAPMTTSPALVLAYATGVLLFAWYALVRAEARPALLRFQPAFLLIVLTLFASLVMLFSQGPQSATLYTFMILDDSFAHMLFWASITCTIASTAMPARKVAGMAIAAYSALSIIWLFLLGDNDTLEAPVMAIVITAIYLLTMIVSHTNSNSANQEEAQTPRNETHEESTALADRIAANIEERCVEIASGCRLSPRETEVLVLLAQGRTRVYIQNELVLAENTVKTHVTHIYKKLDVSNRQEMLDLVFGKNEDPEPTGLTETR